MQYAIAINENNFVPAGVLDNILVKKDHKVDFCFYDFLGANKLTDDNRSEFIKKVKKNIKNKIYPTNDHLITCVKIDDIYFLYVSLDTSRKALEAGHDIEIRLLNILAVVNTILMQLDRKCIVFFSESCKSCESLTWLEMRNKICNLCYLKFLIEKKNLDGGRSMGISVFYSEIISQKIDLYLLGSLLGDGPFGSQVVGVKLKTGSLVWAVHFPIDFNNEGENNKGYKAMIALQKILDETNAVCAFGDFNLIPGNPAESVKLAVDSSKYEFLNADTFTFFGAYFDTINMPSKEIRVIEIDN